MHCQMLDAIRDLYAYNAWANRRILDTAEQMTLQRFLAHHNSAGSIREILTHAAWAHWIWLERCAGRSPQTVWEASAFPYVATLRARWNEVEADTARFLAQLDPADLNTNVTYLNLKGEQWSYPLWQALIHQVTHATQHRSEVALLMTESGHSPGDLDYLIYHDLQG